MNKDFLHNHPNLEKTLLNTKNEPGLARDHVIVDRCDWIAALTILNTPPTKKEYIVPGNVSNEETLEFLVGIKHDSGKPRFDLIPADALEEVAKVYAVGAQKYGDRNWELGMNYGRLFRALMSHAWAWWRGERDDSENKLHHLTSVVFNALALLHYELNSEKFKKFDDRNEVSN